MKPDHIERLRIRVRTADPVDGDLARSAQRFTEAVLAQTAAHLNHASPERLIFVRHLNFDWRLTGRALARPEAVHRFARNITDRLSSQLPTNLPIAEGDLESDVVVFNDEAHWRAAHAIARARSHLSDAWFFEPLEADGDPLATLCLPGRQDLAWRVLEQLAQKDLLVTVLAAAAVDTMVALADGLLPDISDAATSAEDPSLIADLMALTGDLPANLTTKMLALVFFVRARMTTGHAPQSTVTASVAKVLAQLDRVRNLGSGPLQTDRLSSATPPTGTNAPPGQTVLQPADVDTPEEELPQAEIQATGPAVDTLTTQAAGLFYLLNPALELNVGEILWKACLPETQVLAHAAALLVGETLQGDRAVGLFSGTMPTDPLPEVSADQQAEVSESLLTTLVAALPRRGLTNYPCIRIRLTGKGDRRLFVAHALSSPFVIFARPAGTADDVRAAVAEFIDRWPRSAPQPRADSGLAGLDRRARTIPDDTMEDLPGACPDLSLSPSMYLILLQVIGVIGHLFEARVSAAFSPSLVDFTAAYLAIPGKVVLAPEEMTVFFSEAHVDMALRRVGMDRNPGWVQWLGGWVRFDFC